VSGARMMCERYGSGLGSAMICPKCGMGSMSYWQIAAGSLGRDYADRFLRHGLAFVGGEVPCQTMDEVKPGDIVILKRGMTQIVAVGQVVERDGRSRSRGDKEWL